MQFHKTSTSGDSRQRFERHSLIGPPLPGKEFFPHGLPRTAMLSSPKSTTDHHQRPKDLSRKDHCTYSRVNALHTRDYRILMWNLQHALPLLLLNRGRQWTPGSGYGNTSPESPHPKPVGFVLSRKLSRPFW
jgi:hypothetical protein